MSKMGKFIIEEFMNKSIKIFTGLDNEWVHYGDSDLQSYTIMEVIPIGYHKESGILTLTNNKKQKFYMSEDCIHMFWETGSGFKYMENVDSTIGKHWARYTRDRDIM